MLEAIYSMGVNIGTLFLCSDEAKLDVMCGRKWMKSTEENISFLQLSTFCVSFRASGTGEQVILSCIMDKEQYFAIRKNSKMLCTKAVFGVSLGVSTWKWPETQGMNFYKILKWQEN